MCYPLYVQFVQCINVLPPCQGCQGVDAIGIYRHTDQKLHSIYPDSIYPCSADTYFRPIASLKSPGVIIIQNIGDLPHNPE